MIASEHTTNYNLPIYHPDDIPQYLGDEDSWNSTMQKIDTAIHEAAQSGGGGGGESINVVQTTGDSETDVMSQKAVTEAIPQKATLISSNKTTWVTPYLIQQSETATWATATNLPTVSSSKWTVDSVNSRVYMLSGGFTDLTNIHNSYRPLLVRISAHIVNTDTSGNEVQMTYKLNLPTTLKTHSLTLSDYFTIHEGKSFPSSFYNATLTQEDGNNYLNITLSNSSTSRFTTYEDQVIMVIVKIN